MNDEVLKDKITVLECKIIDIEEKLKETKEILDSIKEINISIAHLTEQIKYQSQEVIDMKHKIDTINAKPADRFEKIMMAATTAFISGIIALIITLIFK